MTKLLQITGGAANDYPNLADREDLYGRLITMKRLGVGKTSRCSLVLGVMPGVYQGDGKDIEHEQIWETLAQYWGFDLVPAGEVRAPSGG